MLGINYNLSYRTNHLEIVTTFIAQKIAQNPRSEFYKGQVVIRLGAGRAGDAGRLACIA